MFLAEDGSSAPAPSAGSCSNHPGARRNESIGMESLILLGFDVRAPLVHQKAIWTDERRSTFLLRPEVHLPISVDRDVWPALALNPDEGYPLFLWASVSEMLAAFPEAARSESGSPLIIEIAVVTTHQEFSTYWEQIMFGRLDREVDAALKIATGRLGYDVADRYFVSALSNCMLHPEELAVIRRDWSHAVNLWGLFEKDEDARSFRAVADRLIPEHAPFETYRVCKVEIMAIR
jgi:hypothetical protein